MYKKHSEFNLNTLSLYYSYERKYDVVSMMLYLLRFEMVIFSNMKRTAITSFTNIVKLQQKLVKIILSRIQLT